MALEVRLISASRNGIAAIDICRTSISNAGLAARLQNPKKLNARRRLPRRLSTIRSPPFSAELP
ncbi:hypothetical protein [Bradyrhizobium yuanmingense]|uniref:hypothetical protein n=1 Tax=Bradyrhizobium yuanmingense TaxID=108015 RepID=UPI003514621C